MLIDECVLNGTSAQLGYTVPFMLDGLKKIRLTLYIVIKIRLCKGMILES